MGRQERKQAQQGEQVREQASAIWRAASEARAAGRLWFDFAWDAGKSRGGLGGLGAESGHSPVGQLLEELEKLGWRFVSADHVFVPISNMSSGPVGPLGGMGGGSTSGFIRGQYLLRAQDSPAG
jgi:hypothetical protein